MKLDMEDIKNLSKVFATKEELQQVREEMATKVEMRQVFTILDKIMGELKVIRQEGIFHKRVHERVEERLTKLESK